MGCVGSDQEGRTGGNEEERATRSERTKERGDCYTIERAHKREKKCAPVTVSVHTLPVVELPSPYVMLNLLAGTLLLVLERAGLYLVCVLHAAAVQLTEGIQRSADLPRRDECQRERRARGTERVALTPCQSR